MLYIEDAAKVQITKVKPWAIYFNYENEKYLLKENSSFSSDSEDWDITLYKRVAINDKGHYKLERLTCSWVVMPEIGYRKKNYRIKNKNSRPLRDIDTSFFVLQLTKKKLIRSYFDSYNSPIEKKKRDREVAKRNRNTEADNGVLKLGAVKK